ncbi:MAG: hypothetical protein IH587_00450 [Anaerolineae bacterium]|nr:hypothetical protein [Anaerolineae bacterium]
MSAIPPRQSLGDVFVGALLHQDKGDLLCALGVDAAQTATYTPFVLRYGIRYLGKPALSVVPGLVAIDYGTFLNGEEAWDFLLRRSNLYPRAEVFGYRNDGVDEQVFVRQLDLALTPETLIYANDAATIPLARPLAYVGPEEEAPPRLLEYLPRFDHLQDWRATQP